MKSNKRIITVMVSVLALFLVIVLYLTYFTLFCAPEVINSSYNQRSWEKEQKILRGTIYDRNGVVLAQSEKTDGGQKRVYPFGELFSHTIGYNSRNYGKTGIELSFNSYLLKTQSVIDVLKNESGEDTFLNGANLQSTLDSGMTKLAKELLGKDNGSVVALNPVTGEIYCMYSNPSFNPNEEKLIQNWDSLTEDSNAPFVFRATQGLYAPGSTFKVLSAAAGIEAGYKDYTTDDTGVTNVGGKDFKNASQKAYGTIGMKEAIQYSSNVYFTEISTKIGNETFRETAERFCIMKEIPMEIATKGKTLDFESLDKASLAAVAMGQGALQISPLHMALVASAIANDGVIMKPYLVEKAYYNDGVSVYRTSSKALSTACDKETSDDITEYMKACVESGTGTGARVSGITVAGKTGTAQNEKAGKDHAWFIGFAPAEKPQIAICVMKEYSGRGGGSVCAPAAARIIDYAKKKGIITK